MTFYNVTGPDSKAYKDLTAADILAKWPAEGPALILAEDVSDGKERIRKIAREKWEELNKAHTDKDREVWEIYYYWADEWTKDPTNTTIRNNLKNIITSQEETAEAFVDHAARADWARDMIVAHRSNRDLIAKWLTKYRRQAVQDIGEAADRAAIRVIIQRFKGECDSIAASLS